MKKMVAVFAVAFAVLASVHPAAAQQAEKVWRIGYLTPAPYIWPTFREGLRELGYVE